MAWNSRISATHTVLLRRRSHENRVNQELFSFYVFFFFLAVSFLHAEKRVKAVDAFVCDTERELSAVSIKFVVYRKNALGFSIHNWAMSRNINNLAKCFIWPSIYTPLAIAQKSFLLIAAKEINKPKEQNCLGNQLALVSCLSSNHSVKSSNSFCSMSGSKF